MRNGRREPGINVEEWSLALVAVTAEHLSLFLSHVDAEGGTGRLIAFLERQRQAQCLAQP